MGDLPPGRVRVRRKRLGWAWAAWLGLALFIIVGSAGRWSADEPGIWAPTLTKPADIARNVALYVPFGLFGMLALRRTGFGGMARVTAVALLFSCAVEAQQLYTADRVASVADVASAVCGTILGSAAVALRRQR